MNTACLGSLTKADTETCQEQRLAFSTMPRSMLQMHYCKEIEPMMKVNPAQTSVVSNAMKPSDPIEPVVTQRPISSIYAGIQDVR